MSYVFRSLAVFALLLAAPHSLAQTPLPEFPITDGTVRASALSEDGRTLYIGGPFSYVGAFTGRGARLSASTGAVVEDGLRTDGTVSASAPDGAGGYYIGGDFTEVAGTPRDRLARILSDGSLDPSFDASADGEVLALAVSGQTVYVGGDFATVGGQSRDRIAALDATTGAPTAFDASADGSVFALAVSGETVYAGGDFATIGGQSRNRIAALDATTGTATAFDPDANSEVRALAVSGQTLYAAGLFSAIGGETRNRVAAIDAATGAPTAFNAGSNNAIFALAVDGPTVYVGGDFTRIGGQNRNRIAALDAATGAATDYNPGANSRVAALTLDGETLYAGGEFTSVGGQVRNRVAALDTDTGAATDFDAGTSDGVQTLALSGQTLYVGGDFNSIGGESRRRVAAIDVATGAVTAFDPSANNTVSALAVSGETVYIGGGFTNVGGEVRYDLAAVDAATGVPTSFNAGFINGTGISALAVHDGTLYFGGDFSSVREQGRRRLAAVDAVTGELRAFRPIVGNGVTALVVSGETLYVGGFFSFIGSVGGGNVNRNRIAAFDIPTGALTDFDPNADRAVQTLVVRGQTLYAGGLFNVVGGQTRNRIAAINLATGAATAFDPDASNGVFALALSGETLYAAGAFTHIGGESRDRIAALDVTTGAATAFAPRANNITTELAVSGQTVFAGGEFNTINGERQRGLAAFRADPVAAVTSGAAEGWRMLSAPVTGLTVGDLTDINLVSGVAGDPQCADAVANLFTGYRGSPAGADAGYTRPAAYSDALTPGKGFFWYFWDDPTDAGPCGSGATASAVQPLPVALGVGGPAGGPAVTFAASERAADDGVFYLAGNPFADGFDLDGDGTGLTSITATDGDGAPVAFQNTVQVWDPAGGYVTRTALPDDGTDGDGGTSTDDDLSVWQGVWLERSAAASPAYPLTVTYQSANRSDTDDSGLFIGRQRSSEGLRTLRFEVTGEIGGAAVFDGAASVLFADGAETAWDAYDASKLGALSSPFALIAPVGLGRGGAPVPKAAESWPSDIEGTFEIPLSFSASAAGAFELRWPETSTLPAAWTLSVSDAETGVTTDLRAADRYAFTSDAADASDRFTVTLSTMTVDTESPLADGVLVGLVRPNPARGRAVVSVEVAAAQPVRAEVFNVLGQRIATVFDGQVVPGAPVPLTLDTSRLAAGSYVVRVTGETFTEARRLTVVR